MPLSRVLMASTMGLVLTAGIALNPAGAMFSDVRSNDWFKGAADFVQENGLFQGINGQFMPHKPLTRAEMAVVLERYHNWSMAQQEAMIEEAVEKALMEYKEEMKEEEEEMEDKAVEAAVLLQNLSDDQPLAPGVVVVHTSDVNIDFEGTVAPASLEGLAEIGDPGEFVEFLEGLDAVEAVYETGMIMPGEEMVVDLDEMTSDDLYVSVLVMPAASNDGLALIDRMPLQNGEVQTAENYDAGFEENEELGSGFEGGQPDPSRGSDNVDNGDATVPQGTVVEHDQLTEAVLRARVQDGDQGDMDDEDNIVETAMKTDSLSTLVAALEAGDLVETLEGEGPFTVFAPTNAAFSEIQGTVDTLLMEENKDDLVDVLTYHVVAGEYDADDNFNGETTLETVNGQNVRVNIDEDGTVTVNGATVITADIETANGVVHIINTVLVPAK